MNKIIALAATGILVTLSACGQQGTTVQSAPVEKAQEAKATPTPAPATKTAANKNKPIALNNGKGIMNGNFESWKDGLPASWTLENDIVFKAMDDPMEGKTCIQTGPGYYYNQISQPVTVSGDISGKIVRFTAWARASEKDTVRLILEFPNGEQISGASHPGDGQWHLIEISHTLRKDRSPKRFKAILNHYGRPDRSARFDDARMVIKNPS